MTRIIEGWEISVCKCERVLPFWLGASEEPCRGYVWAITCPAGRVFEGCDYGDGKRLQSSTAPGSSMIADLTGYTREEFLAMAGI